MKIVTKIDNTNKIHLPTDVMEALNIKGGDELVWDLTDILTDDINKQSYTAATLSTLDDYEHEERFRDES